MNPGFILEQYILTLGWTLLHLVWQGAAIWILCECALRLTASSGVRYGIALSAFLALVLTPIVTFVVLLPEPGAPVEVFGLSTVTAVGTAEAAPGLLTRAELLVEQLLPWAVLIWLAGVVFHAARFVKAFVGLGVLVQAESTRPLPAKVADRVEALIGQLGIRRMVLVMQSGAVSVPTVLGWLRPVVLMPPAVLSGLSTQQLDLILAHELAHIRRHDYLVNLLQVVVETVLFYHPAVHAISRRIREEREDCCDDMVVRHLGRPIVYARALTELEGLRAPATELCMAASGGHLVRRIHRLVGRPYHRGSAIWSQVLAVGMLASTVVLAGSLLLPAWDHGSDGAAPEVEAPIADEREDDGVAASANPSVVEPPADSSDADRIVEGIGEFDDMRPSRRGSSSESDSDETLDREAARTGDSAAAVVGPSVGATTDGGVPKEHPGDRAADQDTGQNSGPAPGQDAGEIADPEADPAADAASAEIPDTAPDVASPGGPSDQGPAPTGAEDHSGVQGTDSAAPFADHSGEAPARQRRSAPVPDGPVFGGGRQLERVEPAFPDAAIRDDASGVVRARFTVTESGEVADVTILGRTHPALARSVRLALEAWRFEPFTFEGDPIARRFERRFAFEVSTRKEDYRNGACTPVTGSRVCPVRQFEATEYGVKVLKAGNGFRH